MQMRADSAAESHWVRWCREVSRQPFQQFLRGHEPYRRLRPDLRLALTPPAAPLLKHKAPEHLGWITLLLDLEGTLLMCRHLRDGGGDDWTGWEAMQSHPTADVILLLPETQESFKRHRYAVYKRPGLDAFLGAVARLRFECVAYSTSSLEMARSMVAQVDRNGVISAVLARKACTLAGDAAVSKPHLFKDVCAVGRDPARTVLIDDWPLGCACQENLLPVPQFAEGTEEWRLRLRDPAVEDAGRQLPLSRLLAVLEQLAGFRGDVRDFLGQSACVTAYLEGLPPPVKKKPSVASFVSRAS